MSPPPPAPWLFELLPPPAEMLLAPRPITFFAVMKIVPPEPALRLSYWYTFPPLASMMLLARTVSSFE
jgi:hypothetical protein